MASILRSTTIFNCMGTTAFKLNYKRQMAKLQISLNPNLGHCNIIVWTRLDKFMDLTFQEKTINIISHINSCQHPQPVSYCYSYIGLLPKKAAQIFRKSKAPNQSCIPASIASVCFGISVSLQQSMCQLLKFTTAQKQTWHAHYAGLDHGCVMFLSHVSWFHVINL